MAPVRVALTICVGAALGFAASPLVKPRFWQAVAVAPEAAAIRADLAGRTPTDPVAAFYRARHYAPLWTTSRALRPAAAEVAPMLADAARDGLDPDAFQTAAVRRAVAAAASGRPADLARADITLSNAVSSYAVALHTPAPADRLRFVDPGVPMPPTDRLGALDAIARAPTLGVALAEVRQMSPLYDGLKAALASASGAKAAQLRLNLDRARALPSELGRRYVLVNPAAQTLWLYDGGRLALKMPVIVGKPTEQTPSMIGLMRYAVLDPYWNVPPDLAQFSIAPHVLEDGPRYLAAHQLQLLSDFSPTATVVDPESIDWSAVASGAVKIRLRQTPGPDNMMGQIKFVLPNPLGIYLHDTPLKGLFDSERRADSSGCVRLSDAPALALALFGHALRPQPGGAPEQRVDLSAPIPVYIVYLTAQPGPGGVAYLPDIYRRDPAAVRQVLQPAAARAS